MNSKLFWLSLIIILLTVFANAFSEEIDWEKLIPAVVEVESGGNPNAYNPVSGAVGLMQITQIVYKEYIIAQGLEHTGIYPQLFNTKDNLDIGYWYLKRIWNHYIPHYGLEQDLDTLLGCWNFGIGNVSKGKKFPKETVDFIRKVKDEMSKM